MHMNRKIDARASNAGMSAAFPNALESSIASASLEAGERSRRKRKESEGLERVGVKRKQMEKMGGSRSGVPEAETSRAAELRWSSSGFRSLMELEESHISSSLSNSSFVATAPPPQRLRTLKSLQEDGALKRGNFNRLMEMGRNMIDEMPCVSVGGCRRIEGFLYKYRRGEELRIVCVCHGNFFTPAEFVKHAGGGDVAQPLKHIVVNPSPSDYY